MTPFYQSFCDLFYASHYVPIFYYGKDHVLLYSCSALENLQPPYFVRKKLSANPSPAIFFSTETGYYGKIDYKKENAYFIVGPFFSGDITPEMLQGFMKAHTFESEKSGEISEFLMSIPKYTYNRFLNMIAYLNFSLNRETIDVLSHFNLTDMRYEHEIAHKHIETAYLAKEEVTTHGTYQFERQLIDMVRFGETQKLKDFLRDSVKLGELKEGKLAENPIRQAKNIFIGQVTIVGKEGAIKGGLDVEQTYQLIDTYIQECEKLISVDSIMALQYNMLIDFTSRVAQNKLPEGVSPDIFACIQFINNHTNELISIDDVAGHIGKSRAYTTAKFKKELGVTINEYITNQKLIEAKNLLKHTDKTLTEISYYLCFSSQSYFSNVFKKKYGITPQKYRDRFNQ